MPKPGYCPRAATGVVLAVAALAVSGCLYRPLYGAGAYAPETSAYALQQIYVAEVDTRVAQQVRNRLIFLLQGGRPAAETAYDLRLRITSVDTQFAASREFRDNTAGRVTVSGGYDLFDNSTRKLIAKGSRVAIASYDRTSQNFANDRAVRDAENRAAVEVAEQLRLAIAADLTRALEP